MQHNGIECSGIPCYNYKSNKYNNFQKQENREEKTMPKTIEEYHKENTELYLQVDQLTEKLAGYTPLREEISALKLECQAYKHRLHQIESSCYFITKLCAEAGSE